MTQKEITELAETPKQGQAELMLTIAQLKSKGANLLQCIFFVRLNQGCSLSEAKTTVINSETWLENKADFLRQQQEIMTEFIQENKDNIENIKMNLSPTGSQVKIEVKKED